METEQEKKLTSDAPFELGDELAAAEEETQQVEKITVDEFKKMFSGGFNVAGAFFKLESLSIKPEEQAGADKTAEKLYQAIDATPYLCKVLCNAEALADWYLIGGFIIGKGVSVAAEIKGASKTDIVANVAERAGEKFAGGVINRFKFWRKKADNDNGQQANDNTSGETATKTE